MRVADTFFDVMAYMSLGIVITILELQQYRFGCQKKTLLFGIMLFLIAVPDYIGLANGGAHPPAPL